MNGAMLKELLERLAALREDSRVRVLVFSSTSTVALSAGADVRESLDADGHVQRMQLFSDFYDAVVGFPRPTVAACCGNVVGGGAELAVSCDLRVAGANVGIRFPGAALGMPVGPARLVTLCGLATAKYLLLTSRTVGAEEALRLGLVHEVVNTDAAEARAIALAEEIASNPPASLARIKSLIHEWDGVVERSHAEGIGQVEFLRSGAAFPSRGGSTASGGPSGTGSGPSPSGLPANSPYSVPDPLT